MSKTTNLNHTISNALLIGALLLVAVFGFRWYSTHQDNKQKAILIQAENYFIQGEYEEAFELYEQLTKKFIDEDFINLRKELAGLNDYADASDEFQQLKLNLIDLLDECPLSKKTTESLEEKSLASLALLLKECYIEAKIFKQEKSALVEALSSVKYLNFTNERGFSIHYLGEVRDSIASGEGIGIWDNDLFYRGAWKNNKREGKGYFKTPKDETYEGEFSNDRRNGFGKYVFRNGDYYVGEWKDGERSGYGTVISAKGDTLVHGFWEKDRYDRRKTKEYKRAKTNGEEVEEAID